MLPGCALGTLEAAGVVQPTLLCEDVDDAPVEDFYIRTIGAFQDAVGQIPEAYVK
jgi:hypothetical protein